ncbi:MAG: hypothetical protein D6743_18735 [Calditrichaeota bacterium]|nr:MAG: hypothetical protein D6743_18735 [Calditrichota bacterium]
MKLSKGLSLALAIFVFAAGCTAENAPEPASVHTSDYLRLLPESTNGLFFANLAKLRETPLGEDLRGELAENWHHDDEYLDFVEKTGVDLRKDVDEVWVAIVSEDSHDVMGGAVVRGRFDRQKIVDYLKTEHPHKFRQDSYRGFDIYIPKDEDEVFCFLNDETILAGKDAWLRRVLDLAVEGGKSVLDNPTMAEYITSIPHKDQLWGVLNLQELSDEWARQLRGHSDFRGSQSIENMKSIVFYTEIDDAMRMFLSGNFDRDEEAELLAEMLTGFKAMAKLAVSDDREAIDMLNDIKIKTEGTTVNVVAKLDRDFFDKFREKRRAFRGRKLL